MLCGEYGLRKPLKILYAYMGVSIKSVNVNLFDNDNESH